MKKLILHLGAHKTASSTIQKYLESFEFELSKNGYYFPEFNLSGYKIVNHSLPFYTLFSHKYCEYNQNKIINPNLSGDECREIYQAQLEDSILNSEGRNIIISGEDISFLLDEELTELIKFFTERKFDIHAIYYIREPYSFTCSAMQESIKTGEITLDNIEVSRISDNVIRFKKLFDKIDFVCFEDTFIDGFTPVSYFFNHLGLYDVNVGSDRVNEGRSNFNVRFLSFFTHLTNFEEIARNLDSLSLPSDLNVKFRFTEKEYQKVRDDILLERKLIDNELGFKYGASTTLTVDELNLNVEFSSFLYEKFIGMVPQGELIRFILLNSTFSAKCLINKIDKTNFSIIRDCAVNLEEIRPEEALELCNMALLIKKDAPALIDIVFRLSNSDDITC